MTKFAILLPLVLLLPGCLSFRPTTPIRQDAGDARVKLKRTAANSTMEWTVVRLEDALEATQDRSLEGARKATREGLVPTMVAHNAAAPGSEPVAEIPRGQYGSVYLMHVKETASAPAIPPPGGPAQPTVLRSNVEVLDDRDQASGAGSHVGLLFIPKLDAAITSVQFSLYPARLWAIDVDGGWNIASITDGFSLDMGIAGASVIGDAPPELAGRVAFTFGGGYTFAKGWAVKAGALVYRDAVQQDELTTSFYLGVSYDLLSGLVSEKKQ
ncbi:MAG: hypothetical protein IPK67_18630 [Planctomycetes bacterium]|nr:hypothetical protein [Planctomycetota bacterium]